MKAIYLHGMGSRPEEWQLECYKDNGLDPYALHIDYNHEPSFDILSEYIEKHNIELLIGRSHGGYLSYWLSEKYGLPCLLINPHLSLRAKKFVSPDFKERKCKLCLVALGSDDWVVDSDRTLQYFETDDNPNKVIKVKYMNGIGHCIDYDTFSEMINWSLKEIKWLK